MGFSAQALDVVYGRSAHGVRARLERLEDGAWAAVASAHTDGDGHIYDWLDDPLGDGPHRIVFDTDSYFSSLGISAAYPEIAICFRAPAQDATCQIQVLLAPYSYSMYFGTRD